MTDARTYVSFAAAHGVDLGSVGVRNRAFSREDTLRAIALLRTEGSVILGGDVYLAEKDRVRPALDNWYVEPRADETPSTFADRSCAAAERYVRGYRDAPGKVALFALVVRER